MDFGYQNYTAYALYNFLPHPPAFGIFTNTDANPRILQIAYDGDDYKTIGSIFEFGSLTDSTPPSERGTLMRRYLDFFDVAPAGPKTLFHCSKNSVCRWNTVDFTDDSFDNVTSWLWEFPGGTPSVSTAQNPSVYYNDAGNYDVKLTVSDGVYLRTITKKKFINVFVCDGLTELTNQPVLFVYPNPAKSLIHLRISEPLQKESKLYIFDFLGRKVMESSFYYENFRGAIPIDVSSLQKGLYIIKLISEITNVTAKVVIE
jgi:PKD repeat protein